MSQVLTSDLTNKIHLAEQLADVSGQVIRSYFRQPNLPSETKHDEVSAIVTIGDRQAETAMVELLQQHAPEDGIIREEGENIPSQNGWNWVLDPIDGTASFVRGLPIFGTLIGLVDAEQRPVLGIVNQPITRERWLGVRGQPSRYNQQPVHNPYVQAQDLSLQEVCLAATTPLMFVTEVQKTVAAKLQNYCRRTAFGGDCFNYVALAMGWGAMPMVILEADMNFYDFCALIPLFEGIGCPLTDWSGNPPTAQTTELLAASNSWLHEQALKLIQA